MALQYAATRIDHVTRDSVCSLLTDSCANHATPVGTYLGGIAVLSFEILPRWAAVVCSSAVAFAGLVMWYTIAYLHELASREPPMVCSGAEHTKEPAFLLVRIPPP